MVSLARFIQLRAQKSELDLLMNLIAITLLHIGVGSLCLDKYINGSVEWIGVPDFLRNDGLPWTLNLLAPYDNWGYK